MKTYFDLVRFVKMSSSSVTVETILSFEPRAALGAPVSVRPFRRSLPYVMQLPENFDQPLFRMRDSGIVRLMKHTNPAMLSPQDKKDVLTDDQGNRYDLFMVVSESE